ncbi:hypothetical protein O7602_26575 [Micromonospora sp. WMMD1128]|uniref:hypothetical protein n=1 Tax=Micromonospora sp. WMMD1128 TaxID=3015150 RepID=UPI00248AAB68|nr:hypothetical protein [Micromonospora sp. WMMD1128]WBB73209.1 hypothetical protein O7602_26575 [Micromonospora sp. WMMD1128]
MDALRAATATPSPGGLPWWLWLALLGLGGGLYYLAECRWWPITDCRKCEGRGKFQPKGRKVRRPCRRCKGTGSRLRFGRKVWNRFARVRKAAS